MKSSLIYTDILNLINDLLTRDKKKTVPKKVCFVIEIKSALNIDAYLIILFKVVSNPVLVRWLVDVDQKLC